MRAAGASRDLDGLLVDGDRGLRIAEIAEQKSGLTRLRQHLALGRCGRNLLREVDRRFVVLSSKTEARPGRRAT